MSDARAMCSGQRVGNLNRVLEGLVERQRTFLQPTCECLSLQILHHEEIDVVLTADVVQDADVRMIEGGDRARLAVEALPELWIVSELWRQDFDCDGTIEAGIAGLVHFAL